MGYMSGGPFLAFYLLLSSFLLIRLEERLDYIEECHVQNRDVGKPRLTTIDDEKRSQKTSLAVILK